jgi:hypothetical protein
VARKKPICTCFEQDEAYHEEVVAKVAVALGNNFLEITQRRGLCPPASRYALHAALSGILQGQAVRENGGNHLTDADMRAAIVKILDEMKAGVMEYVDRRYLKEKNSCLH